MQIYYNDENINFIFWNAYSHRNINHSQLEVTNPFFMETVNFVGEKDNLVMLNSLLTKGCSEQELMNLLEKMNLYTDGCIEYLYQKGIIE